jgi:hypothetical protein
MLTPARGGKEVKPVSLCVLLVLIAASRRSSVGGYVASLRDQRDVVISAIDVLWSGV